MFDQPVDGVDLYTQAPDKNGKKGKKKKKKDKKDKKDKKKSGPPNSTASGNIIATT